ncbi:GNAT family N-acetyltransferase [Streptomyces sp. SID12501]|uniref:GNAT family N-acetyltransferase n=1 Tax=Streptomyces sp. SID12501 TaxID=2706042 RepID=A0A6B3C7Z9_9ACTN|nr:GNAT family N-acetyltransferase [Streptomyces sp. SID12501]NEC92250.1 GNAT family N-acetyltransferase [Streptomyces sp. SID12501]
MTHDSESIEPLRLDEVHTLGGFHRLQQQAQRVDFPNAPSSCRKAFLGQMTHPRPGNSVLAWGARVGGRAVGVCAIGVPRADQRRTADVLHFVVHPDVRRRGVGGRLLATATRHLAGLGFQKLTVFTSGPADGAGPGDAFADATGAVRLLRYQRMSLLVGPPRPTTDGEISVGYELLRWRGGVPPKHRAAFAEISSRLAAEETARSSAGQTPEKFDEDKVQALYAALEVWGYRTYLTAVRHRDTGLLVGYSALGMADSHKQHASQWDTIVLPSHRGRGLGAVLKRANLSWTIDHEPELTTVATWNAAGNAAMLHVNESCGFRVDQSGTLREWTL